MIGKVVDFVLGNIDLAAQACADVPAAFSTHPAACVELFVLGVLLGFLMATTGPLARHLRKVWRLSRVFEAMPPSQKDLVTDALDAGSVVRSPHDIDAQMLVKQEILVKPEKCLMYETVPFCINPDCVREIRRHMRWLDD